MITMCHTMVTDIRQLFIRKLKITADLKYFEQNIVKGEAAYVIYKLRNYALGIL